MLFFCFLFLRLVLVIPIKINKIRSSRLTSKFSAQTPKREKLLISIEHLPRELASNILSRLPSKDLMKCKHVSKSWYDLISDPHFVTNYYVVYNNLMHSKDKHLLVIFRSILFGLKTSISILSCNVNQPTGRASLKLPNEYNSDHKYWTQILGPCNGIYFLDGNPYVMMNPSLRQFKVLPESHLINSCETYFLSDYTGFGFDSKTDDYKVAVMKDVWLKETNERQLGNWVVELCSLNSNSWRKIETSKSNVPLPFEIWDSSRVYTYVNNCCHWWAFVDESSKRDDVVLAFDMVSETFRKIKVPKIRESAKEAFATLVPFEESTTIGVIVCPVREKDRRYDLWVMRDYWDEGSWIKQYSVGPIEVVYKLVGSYGRNQFLWKDSNEGLVLYEPESQEIEDLQVYAQCDSLKAARYMESLVSLQRGNEFSGQFVLCSLVSDTLAAST